MTSSRAETGNSEKGTLDTGRLAELMRPDRFLKMALNNPVGAFLSPHLIDAPALWWVTRVFMPLSRLWAAADAAAGDPARFLAEVPVANPDRWKRDRIARLLDDFEDRRAAAEAADSAWLDGFFGGGRTSADRLSDLESERVGAAQKWLLARVRFTPLILRGGVPSVRFDIPGLEEAENIYGPAKERPEQLYEPPSDPPHVDVSRAYRTRFGRDYWIRFPSPSARIGGMFWARVHEPREEADLPTVIFGNGVCIEWDQMRRRVDIVADLCRAGCRVIEIEAPWHGRRREPGTYSGEPFIARAPVGGLDLMTAQVREIAALTAWLRGNGVRRVGLAGISMGALASLLAAGHARHWPAQFQPDALALITFSGALHRLPLDSGLAQGAGLREAALAKGWTGEKLDEYAPFTDVSAGPGLDPANVMAVVGKKDVVTPFADAHPLLSAWGVPEENISEAAGGHFSTPMATGAEHAVLRRFVEALKA